MSGDFEQSEKRAITAPSHTVESGGAQREIHAMNATQIRESWAAMQPTGATDLTSMAIQGMDKQDRVRPEPSGTWREPSSPDSMGSYEFTHNGGNKERMELPENRRESGRLISEFVDKYERGMSQNDAKRDLPTLVDRLKDLGFAPQDMARAINSEFVRRAEGRTDDRGPLFSVGATEGKTEGSVYIHHRGKPLPSRREAPF